MKDLKNKPDPQFGGCPKCGKIDKCLVVGEKHYFTCETHKSLWKAKKFDDFHLDIEYRQFAIERAKRDGLAHYLRVKPRHWKNAEEERLYRKRNQAKSQLTKALADFDVQSAIEEIVFYYDLGFDQAAKYVELLNGALGMKDQYINEMSYSKQKNWLRRKSQAESSQEDQLPW
jgi:hypothetical protein